MSIFFTYTITESISSSNYPIIARIEPDFIDETEILSTKPLPLTQTATIMIPSTNDKPHLHIWDHKHEILYQATGPLIITLPSREVQRGSLYKASLDTLPLTQKKALGGAVKNMLIEHYFPGSSLSIRYLTYLRYRFRSERNYDHWGTIGRDVWERGRKLGELPGGTGLLHTWMNPFGQRLRNDHDHNLTTQIINQSRREGWNRITR